jgi:hypothetical protein
MEVGVKKMVYKPTKLKIPPVRKRRVGKFSERILGAWFINGKNTNS